LKLYLNYCNPQSREKEENNLIFGIKTGTIPMVVTIEYTHTRTNVTWITKY